MRWFYVCFAVGVLACDGGEISPGDSAERSQTASLVGAPSSPTFGGRTVGAATVAIAPAGAMRVLAGVTADQTEATVIAATFEGTATIRGTLLVSAGGTDALLAKVDALGRVVFAKRLGDAGAQQATAVATTASGEIALLGTFEGTLDLGDGVSLTSRGFPHDWFVARFGPDGRPRWARRITPEPEVINAQAIAVDRAGNTFVVGFVDAEADFAGTIVRGAGYYLAKLDAAGAVAWVRIVFRGSDDAPVGLVTDRRGTVYIGTSDGRGSDINFMALNPDGTTIYTTTFRDRVNQEASLRSFDVDHTGRLVFLSSGVPQPGPGVQLCELDATGTLVRVVPLSEPAPTLLRFHPWGGVVVAGTAFPTTTAFVARLDLGGQRRWLRIFAGTATATALAVSPWGSTLVGGTFDGVLDLGAGAFASHEGPDLYVGKLLP